MASATIQTGADGVTPGFDELLGFPPGREFILLPRRPARATLGGLALYDAASFRQRMALRTGRGLIRIGLGGLLQLWRSEPPLAPAWWGGWVRDVAEPKLGPVTCSALRVVDDPSNPPRRVSALLFDAAGRPLAFAKLLGRESDRPASSLAARVIEALGSDASQSIRVPRLIASGIHDDFEYLIQESLPEAGHGPMPHDPRTLYAIVDEVQRRLATVVARPPHVPPHHVPTHGSLTPLNLRVSADRQVWLLDWDHVGWGPRLSDELRYWIADFARRPGAASHKARRVLTLLRQRGSQPDLAVAMEWRRSIRGVERLAREQAIRESLERLVLECPEGR